MEKPDLEYVARSLKDSDFPPQITLEITAFCNLKCAMCTNREMKREKGEMDLALYKKCVDEIARENKDTSFWIPDNGEALLLGDTLFDMIKYAKYRSLRDVNLNTNGVLFDDVSIERLLATGIDRVVFGIDAVTSETYQKVRVGGDYESVATNVRTLLKKRESLGAKKPEVTVQFIVMDENEHEEEAFKEYWLEQGAVVKIRQKLTWGGCIDSSKLDARDDERIPCVWMCNLFHVFWDGAVPRCSGDHEGENTLGNIKDESISSVWNGKLKYYRELHLQGKYDQLPRQCHVCRDWQVGGSEKHSPALSEK